MEPSGSPIFVIKAAQAVHFAEKIHRRTITQINDGIRADVRPQPAAEVQHANILP